MLRSGNHTSLPHIDIIYSRAKGCVPAPISAHSDASEKERQIQLGLTVMIGHEESLVLRQYSYWGLLIQRESGKVQHQRFYPPLPVLYKYPERTKSFAYSWPKAHNMFDLPLDNPIISSKLTRMNSSETKSSGDYLCQSPLKKGGWGDDSQFDSGMRLRFTIRMLGWGWIFDKRWGDSNLVRKIALGIWALHWSLKEIWISIWYERLGKTVGGLCGFWTRNACWGEGGKR